MASELDFCRHLLAKFFDLWEAGKAPYAEPFLEPLDEVLNNAPGYYAAITSPMDLTIMGAKLEGGQYNSAEEFKADFDLMIANCLRFNKGNSTFLKRTAERFVREFTWDWEQMGKWRSRERRRLALLQPASAVRVTVASGSNASIASCFAAERSSGPSPELGSPSGLVIPSSVVSSPAPAAKRSCQDAEENSEEGEPRKRARVDESSEDAVDQVMDALSRLMAQQIKMVAAEKEAEMDGLEGGAWSLWEKIWGPDHRETSFEVWRAKAFSNITAEEWPNSWTAVRREVLAAWSETTREQMEFLEQEEAFEAERKAAKKAEEKAEFLRRLLNQ